MGLVLFSLCMDNVSVNYAQVQLEFVGLVYGVSKNER